MNVNHLYTESTYMSFQGYIYGTNIGAGAHIDMKNSCHGMFLEYSLTLW